MNNEDSYHGATDMPAGYEGFQAYIRSEKVKAVGHEDGPDLPPVVRVETCRPLDIEITAMLPRLDIGMALWAADVLCQMIRPCSITLMIENFGTEVKHNPATGKPWGRGEMQAHFDAGNADDLVSEALTWLTVFRNGRSRMEETWYTRTGNTMRWTKSMNFDSARPGEKVEGDLHERLSGILLRPPHPSLVVLQSLFEQMGLEGDDRFRKQITSALRTLGEQQILCAVGMADRTLMDSLLTGFGEHAHQIPMSPFAGLDPTLADLGREG